MMPRSALRYHEFFYQKRFIEKPNPAMCEALSKLCASNYKILLEAYKELAAGKYEKKCEPEKYTEDLGPSCQFARDLLMLGIGEGNLKPDTFYQLETNNCRRIEIHCGDKFQPVHAKLIDELSKTYQDFYPHP